MRAVATKPTEKPTAIPSVALRTGKPRTSELEKTARRLYENQTDEEIREVAINNAMGIIEELCGSLGVPVEFSSLFRDPKSEVTASILADSQAKFQFTGDTDQALITGLKTAVSTLVRKLVRVEAALVKLQPSKLPTGVWVTRDSNGSVTREDLYPSGCVKRGHRQTFEPCPIA